MTTHVFENAGVIDPRSICMFGVSVKESKSPIGYFGTGLKYAIAVILRLGGSISITTGGNHYAFSTENATIRDKEFRVVTMNGEPLGFTTELGKNWQAWQAWRELYCNAVDEDGGVRKLPAGAVLEFRHDHTYVIVSGECMDSAAAEHRSIVLPDKDEYTRNSAMIEVRPGRSDWVYYRGIRCHKLERPSLMTYNVLATTQLTEDRTLATPYIVNLYAEDFYKNHVSPNDANGHRMLMEAMTAPKDTFERNLPWSGPHNETFKHAAVEMMRAFNPMLHPSIPPMIRETSLVDIIRGEPMTLDALDLKRVNNAKKFLRKLGYEVDKYPICFTEHMGDEVLGRAVDGSIFISKRALMMGTKMLAGTILEEYLHLRHGLHDETRQMQNFLIDTIITMGERITKDPL